MTPPNEGKGEPMKPIESLLGKNGEPPMCKIISSDISVHWFGNSKNGKCLCGKTEDKKLLTHKGKRRGNGQVH